MILKKHNIVIFQQFQFLFVKKIRLVNVSERETLHRWTKLFWVPFLLLLAVRVQLAIPVITITTWINITSTIITRANSRVSNRWLVWRIIWIPDLPILMALPFQWWWATANWSTSNNITTIIITRTRPTASVPSTIAIWSKPNTRRF